MWLGFLAAEIYCLQKRHSRCQPFVYLSLVALQYSPYRKGSGQGLLIATSSRDILHFLQGLRDVTEQEGALLCFDEVMTGFRSDTLALIPLDCSQHPCVTFFKGKTFHATIQTEGSCRVWNSAA